MFWSPLHNSTILDWILLWTIHPVSTRGSSPSLECNILHIAHVRHPASCQSDSFYTLHKWLTISRVSTEHISRKASNDFGDHSFSTQTEQSSHWFSPSKPTKSLVPRDFEKISFFVLVPLKPFHQEPNHQLNQFSTDVMYLLLGLVIWQMFLEKSQRPFSIAAESRSLALSYEVARAP